jgi:hypothetical protein
LRPAASLTGSMFASVPAASARFFRMWRRLARRRRDVGLRCLEETSEGGLWLFEMGEQGTAGAKWRRDRSGGQEGP